MDNKSRNDKRTEKVNPYVPERRDFLKKAALAGLGTAILSSTPGNILQAGGMVSSSDKTDNMCPPILTQKRVLGTGSHSLTVSEIALGCMGMVAGRGAHPDYKSMIKLIRQAYDLGVDLFDTAEGYGAGLSEEMLGEAVRPFRDKVVVSSKFSGVFQGDQLIRDNRPERIRKACEYSLKRLNMDVIDIYFMHRNDKVTPIEEVARTVADLIREGKVKYFGMCEVGAETIRRAHAVQPVTVIQSEYSLMYRKPEEAVFPTMQELGISFLPYSPIGRGFLGGNITEYTKFDPKSDSRGSSPRFTPEAIRANLKFVEAIHQFGSTRGITSAQVSLSWMLAKYPFIVPLIGTSKLSHLEEDLRASAYIMTGQEINELESILSAIPIIGERYSANNQGDVEY